MHQHCDYSTQTYVLTELTNGTFTPVNSTSSVSVGSTSYSYSSYTTSASSRSGTNDNSRSFTAIINTEAQSFDFVYGASFTLEAELSCYIENGAASTYSLVQYIEAVPDWIEIDSATGIITSNSTPESGESEYLFYIRTSAACVNDKLITINLYNIPIEPESATDSVTKPASLNDYSKASGDLTSSVAAVGVTGQVLVAPAQIPSIINGMQNYPPLSMFKAESDRRRLATSNRADVDNYIYSQSYSLFNFNFVPFRKIPGVNYFTELMDGDQLNPALHELGFDSRSAFKNSFSLLWVFLISL
jgi:hypothetical protein